MYVHLRQLWVFITRENASLATLACLTNTWKLHDDYMHNEHMQHACAMNVYWYSALILHTCKYTCVMHILSICPNSL